MTSPYLFTTSRLGFRTWQNFDLGPFAAINADPEVMRFFQKPLSTDETLAMMERMQRMYEDRGSCYFAVDHLGTRQLIGTIGLGWKTFEADFTPCVDIGWRLDRKFWNQGFSTEGALACIQYGKSLEIKEIVSMASQGNTPSIRVMRKIGMDYWKNFDHPDLVAYPQLNPCVLYRISV